MLWHIWNLTKVAGFIANERASEFEEEVYKFAKAMKDIKIVTTLEFNILAKKLIGPNEKHIFLPDTEDMWLFVNEGTELNNTSHLR